MVIWKNVIKGIVRASLPTIIFPLAVVALVIHFFGLTIDSLLAIIFLGEFYIIWGQLEVALRQTRLSVLEYTPEFTIETEMTIVGANGTIFADTYLGKVNGEIFASAILRNVGEHLARNIHITAITEAEQSKYKFVTNLAPKERVLISTFKKEILDNRTIRIEIDYEDILGDYDGITFVKKPEFPDFLAVGGIRRMPGILLGSLEDLTHIFKSFTLSRRMKKIRKITK